MKTLIIGGGMAGLTYGILSSRFGHETVICERNARCGKKLSQTGNGKCNIGNADVSARCFNNSSVARAVCGAVPNSRYVEFLDSCGIFTFTDSVGRMYPLCESASAVVDCLRTRFEKFGGKFLTESEVTSANRLSDGRFEVFCREKLAGTFDKVVLACGSGSGALQPNVFDIVPKKYFTPFAPSLVPLKIRGMDRQLNGLRAKAEVTLLCDDRRLDVERGEIQFKDYGVSGICVFNLSAQIARREVLGEKHRYALKINLVPSLSSDKLGAVLQSRIDGGEPIDTLFYGILHNKLAQSVVKQAQLGSESDANGARDKSSDGSFGKNVSAVSSFARCLAFAAKNFTLQVDKLLDFSMSQVTAGGISEQFLDVKTLSLPNGIVAVGEVLNVDGICGGNNLYFAAASAIYAFQNSAQ